MNHQKDKDSFTYTYSASEQEEVKRIRQKYLPKTEDKMERLRKLDKSTTRRGTVVSLIFGLVGTLLFGTGMSFAMVWTEELLFAGILIGVVGIVLVSLAHPLYSYITKKERERIAPEIIRLTDDLLK